METGHGLEDVRHVAHGGVGGRLQRKLAIQGSEDGALAELMHGGMSAHAAVYSNTCFLAGRFMMHDYVLGELICAFNELVLSDTWKTTKLIYPLTWPNACIAMHGAHATCDPRFWIGRK